MKTKDLEIHGDYVNIARGLVREIAGALADGQFEWFGYVIVDGTPAGHGVCQPLTLANWADRPATSEERARLQRDRHREEVDQKIKHVVQTVLSAYSTEPFQSDLCDIPTGAADHPRPEKQVSAPNGNSPVVFTVSNHHAKFSQSVVHPCVDGDDGDYHSYFENRYGEQWLFTRGRNDGRAYVCGGDADWIPHEVKEGARLERLILNEEERLWLKACLAACGDDFA